MMKMKKLLIMPMTYCRSNGYFVIGVCLGILMSLLLFQNEIDDYNFHEPIKSSRYSYIFSTIDESLVDEYIPKINVEGKPLRPQKSPKSFVRPRYYFTELGIRERLFMGVLTSQEYLHNRGVVFNRTVGHLVDKIRYFISIPEGTRKPNISLSGIVGFTDTRSVLKPFHVIKYITDNYIEDYDYYYIVKDKSYVNGRKLISFIERMSVSRDVYLGIPSKYDENYCSLGAGILLSNSLIRKLKTSLDWCVKNIYSTSDDINFGVCVYHATNIACSSKIGDTVFNGKQFPWNFNLHKHLSGLAQNHQQLDRELIDIISIYPIGNHEMAYRLNAYFLAIELKKVEETIRELRKQILSSIHLGPNNKTRNITPWPVGNWQGNKPPGRFDILRWNYFNETHIFMQTDFENYRELIGAAKLDIDRVLQAAINKIIVDSKNKLKFNKLVNGYMKFDASRGMDYILDISLDYVNEQLEQQLQNKRILKRIQISKPLDKVEILPVPYVTENTRINMVLIVYLTSINESLEFIEHYANVCMEKRDKTSLMLVLIYNRESPSKGSNDIYHQIKDYAINLTNKYRSQSKISWLSIRLSSQYSNLTTSDSIFQIAVTDSVVQKFSPESLLLFVQTKSVLTTEYLNRIRMNTISQWQIFCPIPFTEFHPDLAYADESKNIEMDLNRNHGRYDDLNYESISFYKRDYQIIRKTSEKDIPILHGDKDIANKVKIISNLNIDSLYEFFIVYGKLHVFRAIEPALKIYYTTRNCSDNLNEIARKKCMLSKSRQLGHRGQLARLIQEYQEN